MPDGDYRPPEGLVSFSQAAERLGVSLPKLRRMVERTGVQTFEDPRDARYKLVRQEDLERLMELRPRERQNLKTAA